MRLLVHTLAGLAILFVAALVLITPVLAACGTASWYGTESGNRTANGEPFNGTSMTCAHRSLPFGTKLKLTYGGKTAICRVNDRGPYIKGRSLDLSRAVAVKLGMIHAGVGQVCWERL